MQGLDHFEVECTEETGGRYYERIASDVLLDHDLLKVVHKVHIYIDPAVPVFVAAGLTRKLPPMVTLGDFASINRQEGKVILNITEETYLAPLLLLLWSRFGNDRVSQPDRFTIILSISMDESEDLEEMEVADPREALYRDLIYAFHLIAPEGFKVRRQHIREGRISYIASEDAVPDHVAEDLFRRVFEAMGVEP
ncbi:MAG: methanogenesis marker 17 protein [Methanomicrobiales archaeon]